MNTNPSISSSTTTTAKTIEITVDPNGSISVQTRGFIGQTCKDASQFLERALGNVRRETKLPEYFQQHQANEQIQQGT